jgi:hypothetical protein
MPRVPSAAGAARLAVIFAVAGSTSVATRSSGRRCSTSCGERHERAGSSIIASIAIQFGATGGPAPERRARRRRMGLKALLAGAW